MRQRKTYDIFVREGDTLKWVKSYHQWLRTINFMFAQVQADKEPYARCVLTGKMEWYGYSSVSSSGFSYAHSDIYSLEVIER